MTSHIRPDRQRAVRLSRAITLGVVVATLGSLAVVPTHPLLWAIDVLVRTYLMFIGTVMAHEASHGHLGRGRRPNLWWGRLALLPVTVPYSSFRKTHALHHKFTNDPDRDPDYFARPRRLWEIPLRAVAMPHHWLFWLRRRGHTDSRHLRELLGDYARVVAVHGSIGLAVGPVRYLAGMVPALVLVSVLLWYPFAIKTHEGWLQGRAEVRSHDYYGHFMYWFSLGLSLHQVHHLEPALTWLELRGYVRPPPGSPRLWRPQRSRTEG